MTALGTLVKLADCEHKTSPISPHGEYFAVGTPAMRGNVINYTEARRIDQNTFELWTRRMTPRAGDVLFAREAPVGPVVRVPKAENVAPGQRTVLIRAIPGLLDECFLFYLLQSPGVQSVVQSLAAGSTVPHLNVADVRMLDVGELPAIHIQRAIGDVLGALDDKIAANREASRWIDEYLAGAFERELTSAIQVRLGDVAEVNAESVKPEGEGWIKYVDISTLKEGELLTPTRIPWPEAPGRARRALHSGDTLWSTVRPNRRSHALMLGSAEELVASTGIAVITPRRCRASELYEATRRASFQEYLESVAEGSTYPAVRADRFSDAAIDLLQGDGRERFAAVGEPLRMLQWSLREESEHLATTRDELLPLLMSGKITVKDAEKTVEGVL